MQVDGDEHPELCKLFDAVEELPQATNEEEELVRRSCEVLTQLFRKVSMMSRV
jgi:hypothetical protein